MPPDEEDPDEAGRVDGKDEQRIRVSEFAEELLDLFREEDEQGGNPPGQPERQDEEQSERSLRHRLSIAIVHLQWLRLLVVVVRSRTSVAASILAA